MSKTKKQKLDCDLCDKTWAFMSAYYKEHGFAPTYRQIADAVGVVSKSSVSVHIHHLETAGLVKVSGQRGAVPVEGDT